MSVEEPQWMTELRATEGCEKWVEDILALADWLSGGERPEEQDSIVGIVAFDLSATLCLMGWRTRPDGPLPGQLGTLSLPLDWPDGSRNYLVVVPTDPTSSTPASLTEALALLTVERQRAEQLRLDSHEAIRRAWRSGYLACAHDRDEGETGLGDHPEDGCHDPEQYLWEVEQGEPR